MPATVGAGDRVEFQEHVGPRRLTAYEAAVAHALRTQRLQVRFSRDIVFPDPETGDVSVQQQERVLRAAIARNLVRIAPDVAPPGALENEGFALVALEWRGHDGRHWTAPGLRVILPATETADEERWLLIAGKRKDGDADGDVDTDYDKWDSPPDTAADDQVDVDEYIDNNDDADNWSPTEDDPGDAAAEEAADVMNEPEDLPDDYQVGQGAGGEIKPKRFPEDE